MLNYNFMRLLAARLRGCGAEKKFEKNRKNDLTNEKSMLNYNSIAPDEGGADCKEQVIFEN